IIYVLIVAYLNPKVAPTLSKEELAKYTTKDKVIGLLHILPVLFVVLTVLGSIWYGIAPPTEAAALGALASMLLALAYRKLNLKVIKEALYRTLQTTGMIYGIMFLATFFVSVFMRLGGGDIVVQAFDYIPFGSVGILITMLLLVFLLGLIMDWIASILIIVPIFTPIAANLGFDPI